MFYEKQVRSFPGLMAEVRRMDSDSGVRILGAYQGRDCYAFLTRSVGTFTVMLYERSTDKAQEPGKQIGSREFRSVDELERFLKGIAGKKLDAHVY